MVPLLTFSMHHSIKDGKQTGSSESLLYYLRPAWEQDYKPYDEPATDSSHGSMVLRCCSGGVCVLFQQPSVVSGGPSMVAVV